MASFNAKVYIKLKQGILDPQGKAVENALGSLGFSGMSNVRVGKLVEMQVDDVDVNAAEQSVQAACDKLLANPNIESYNFELLLLEEAR